MSKMFNIKELDNELKNESKYLDIKYENNNNNERIG